MVSCRPDFAFTIESEIVWNEVRTGPVTSRKDTCAVLIHPGSLSDTIDAVNEAIASGQKISASARKAVARWIASRQGLQGAYANTFAGFESEQQRGIRLFTGERVNSASARHILGEEACRALRQLDVHDQDVRHALAAR